MERILFLLAAPSAREAAEAIRSARDMADAPERLSVGLLTDSVRGLPGDEGLAALRTAPFADPWKSPEAVWQGETWILLGDPAMRFEKRWDRALTREAARWQERSAAGAVITGCLPAPEDAVRAVAPVAAARFDFRGMLVQAPGVPLRYAEAGEPGALVHPRFCFARAGFFRAAAAADCAPFWTAFRGRWAVVTLGSPVISLTQAAPLPEVCAPEDDADGRARFARHFGIDFDRRTVSAKASEGVWRAELAAPARVPLRVRMQETLRALDMIGSRLTPLAVTCRLALPERGEAEAVALARFRRLASLRSLPLMCFADRESRAQTEKLCADTVDYQPRYALPTAAPLDSLNKETYLRLSAPFLLAAARERVNGRSHYVWLDDDLLRYPVWERTAIDWPVICGERITVATVDGAPDPTAFAVPEPLVLPLCRAFGALCDEIVRGRGALPEAEEVWRALLDDSPSLFDPIDLPGARELFALTMPGKEEEW